MSRLPYVQRLPFKQQCLLRKRKSPREDYSFRLCLSGMPSVQKLWAKPDVLLLERKIVRYEIGKDYAPRVQMAESSKKLFLLVSFCFMVRCISVSLHLRVSFEGFAADWTRNLAGFYSPHWYLLR